MTVTIDHLGPGRLEASTSAGSVRLQILGSLRVWRGETEVDPGPRQQAYLLALLLARDGRPTGTGELIDLIWGENAPASALNVIHKYIGSLRRLLEPDLPPRQAGTYLLKRGNGYLWGAGPDVLDLSEFRLLSSTARDELAEGNGVTALEHFVEALDLWKGPAGDGWTHGPAAAPIFAGLNDEYFQACVEAAEAALSTGQPDRLLPALHLAAAMAPMHEPVQASLVTLLGGAGNQAEALTLFDSVRRRLAEELGIDPGTALKEAHRRVLAQTPMTRATTIAPTVAAVPSDTSPPGPPTSTTPTAGVPDPLVGRAEELAVLRRAVEPALRGATAVVLLEGEPGAGKSRLMEEIAHHAEGHGARVVWGHGLEGEGTPTMWPWVEIVTGLLDATPTKRREEWLAGDLGHLVGAHGESGAAPAIADGNARFRLLDRVADLIAESVAEQPLVMMFDDLHWADTSSLQLLDHVVARLPSGAAVVGALRNQGPSPRLELVRTLAAASRTAGHRRVLVGPLGPSEVAELVQLETGVILRAEVARLLHARTAGNPFFVRELARGLAASGTVTEEAVLSSGVPMTVRDVVRSRLAVLDADAQGLLAVASLVGRSVELALLARTASLDVATCLQRLEPVRSLGLIGPTSGDPFSYRFTHDLVRQAVSEAITPGRAAALHGRIAEAIEEVGLHDESVAERVAHHLWSAGPMADPHRTIAALTSAGARAQAKTALGAAERHLGSAVDLARRSSLPELELAALSQLISVVGMRSMYGTAVSLLERAEQVAQRLGREREAAGFLFSRWTAHGQALELDRSTPLAQRLRAWGNASEDPVVHAYGEAASGIHEWCLGNVGTSYRQLSALRADARSDDHARDRDPVRDGVQLMAAGMFAEIAGYHGETALARTLLGGLTEAAGDDPYAVTVATSFEARTAAVLGDTAWALSAAERGIAADPHFSFTSLGTYLRLGRCWALATSGHHPGAADEAERLILDHLSSPARTCVSTWYALLAEMRMASGSLDAAASALDRADDSLERFGQRSAEALVILMRGHLASVAGDGRTAIRHAEQARDLALRQEAHAFALRAERLLVHLRR